MFAIVSDIHANIEALQAVLRDIAAHKVNRIVCLGDVIGYGPNPREALIGAMKYFEWTIRGNHEDALLFVASDFNPEASRAIDWTRDQLNNPDRPSDENHALWNFLGDLGTIKREEDVMYVHASPRDHTKEYVRPPDIEDKERMADIFEQIPRICFCGHTHEPGVFTQQFRFFPPKAFNNKVRLNDQKFMINVGSVGQPRDKDIRACYVLFDGEVVQFRRVEYDVQKTVDKVLATKALPEKFGTRLLKGR
jgi:predicted phosphodiesterase